MMLARQARRVLALAGLLLANAACAQPTISKGNIPFNQTVVQVPPSLTLSSPWLQTDVGTPPVAGTAFDQGGVLTVKGSGDLSNGGTYPDSGHWVYQQKTGNFGIKTCVISASSDSIWERYGVMIRDATKAASYATDAFMSLTLDLRSATPPLRSSWRQTIDGNAQNGTGTEVVPSPAMPPGCISIERNGTAVTTFYGYDISSITTQHAATTITFAGDIYLGFWVSNALSSGNGTANTSVPVIYSVGGSTGTLQYNNQSSTSSINENVTPATFCVSRAGGTTGAASVQITNLGTGTAVAGTDFTNIFPATLNWSAGQSGDQCASLTIINRAGSQPNRTLNLGLGTATGATIGSPNTFTLTILDVGGDPQLTTGGGNYFIDPSGTPGSTCSDSWNGQYPAFVSGSNGPWCSGAAAASKTFTNTDLGIFHKVGTTETGHQIEFGNTTAHGLTNGTGGCTRRFIDGAYYIISGNAYEGLNGGARPILRGTQGWFNHGRLGGTNLAWVGGGTPNVTVPQVSLTTGYDNTYEAIWGSGSEIDCLQVENLAGMNWGGRGLGFTNAVGLYVSNMYIENTWREGFICEQCTGPTIDGSYIVGYGFNTRVPSQPGYYGGSGITCRTCLGFTFTNNRVWDGWGEAMSAWSYGGTPSTGGLIQGNFVLDGFAVIFYASEMRTSVVRQNVFARTSISQYDRGGECITHADEDEAVNYGVLPFVYGGAVAVYSNIIAGCKAWGFNLERFSVDSTHDHVYYYGNLFVDNCLPNSGYNIGGVNTAWTGGRWWSNWAVSYIAGCTNNMNPTAFPGGGNPSKDYWSVTPNPSQWSDAGDVVGGCGLTKTTGWNTLDDLSATESDGHKTQAEMQGVLDGIIAGARPVNASACKNSGVTISSRTLPTEITQTNLTGLSYVDFDGNAYITPDIGPFRQ
jgi:hypothetical protein